jgi:hypothetical protein
MKNEKMYIHEISGDVASLSDWKADFDSMDVESWFGLPADECEGMDWIEGGKLIEVVQDEDGEWVMA